MGNVEVVSQHKLLTPAMQLESEIVRNKFGIVIDLQHLFITRGKEIKFYKISDREKTNCLYTADAWSKVRKLAYYRPANKKYVFADAIATLI